MNPTAAAKAYTSIASLTDKSQAAAQQTKAAGDAGTFQDLVMSAVNNVAESGHAVEAQAASLAAGKTDVVDLVTAVAETELALETVVTIRDRMISAYQDILNMPI
jgi:flagellar hook-basal body complex protein FliE